MDEFKVIEGRGITFVAKPCLLRQNSLGLCCLTAKKKEGEWSGEPPQRSPHRAPLKLHLKFGAPIMDPRSLHTRLGPSMPGSSPISVPRRSVIPRAAPQSRANPSAKNLEKSAETVFSRTADALEIAALAAAVGGHAIAVRTHVPTVIQPQLADAKRASNTAAGSSPPNTIAGRCVLLLTVPLVIAALCRRLAAQFERCEYPQPPPLSARKKNHNKNLKDK